VPGSMRALDTKTATGGLGVGPISLLCWSYYDNSTPWAIKMEPTYYSAKKLKLRRVLQILCGAFERCSRVRL